MRAWSCLRSVPLLSILVLLACEEDAGTTDPGDTVAPARVTDLAAARSRGEEAIVLTWTAPGDDGLEGRASSYEIRYADGPITGETWDFATTVENVPEPGMAGEMESLTLPELGFGTWYAALRSADEVPNWSELSNVASTAILPDTLPPDPIDDLVATASSQASVRLAWTAPGDAEDGLVSAYDVRYAESVITDETWDAATVVVDPPVPGEPDADESLTVEGLSSETTYHFAIRSADSVPNWSVLSSLASATTPADETPPDPVTEFEVVGVLPTAVSITWIASGDDGMEGFASAYDVRRATMPITDDTWDEATPVPDPPSPGVAGEREHILVEGLVPEITTYLAMRVEDESGNASSLSDVIAVTPDRLVRLTVTSGSQSGARAPAWSPDGASIAYTTDIYREFHDQVYVRSLVTGDVRRMTNDCDYSGRPSWSPDGTKIAFMTHRYDDDPFCEDWETGVWSQPAEPFASRRHLVEHGNGAFVSRPTWSPDGAHIVYSVLDTFFPNYEDINVIPSDGGAPDVIVSDGFFNSDPHWTPDGGAILFSSDRTGNPEIWRVAPDGSSPTQLTDDPATDLAPRTSPDGSRVAFTSDRAGNHDVWLMDANGGAPVPLTTDLATDWGPTWSPDGRMIAFVSQREREEGADIWVIAVDGR